MNIIMFCFTVLSTCRLLHLSNLVFSHRGLHLNSRHIQRNQSCPADVPNHPSPPKTLSRHSQAQWTTFAPTHKTPLSMTLHYPIFQTVLTMKVYLEWLIDKLNDFLRKSVFTSKIIYIVCISLFSFAIQYIVMC